MDIKSITTDILIIGGGTAGCYAARVLGAHPELSVLIAEKAHISRSGCLAAGVNALNAYISEGHTPEDYADYAEQDAAGIARRDLLLSMSERLNAVTEDLEQLGLVILKDEAGKYVSRGWRNIKINGENIKPVLAGAAMAQPSVTVLNHVNVTDLKLKNGKVSGAVGFGVHERTAYDISARAVLIATAGAAGLYRSNHPGFSRHKLWYSPFNTGAGYAMGILAGAEFTSLEMRFIALRCKDTIAPTGTIAQGVSARQINSRGEDETRRYGRTTQQRMYGVTQEKRAGRGPSYLETAGISAQQETELMRAYLNMAPAQTLRWMERRTGPASENVEIEGTEPYVVGGHTAGGYWVDTGRRTTVPGLYTAGDVSGGCPQKYVTGALAEAAIAAQSMVQDLAPGRRESPRSVSNSDKEPEWVPGRNGSLTVAEKILEYEGFLQKAPEDALRNTFETERAEEKLYGERQSADAIRQMEETMQALMDQSAGGIGSDYAYSEAGLQEAAGKLRKLQRQIYDLHADSPYELMQIYELRERLLTAEALTAHLRARRETRWPGFGVYAEYPEPSPAYECYVNSRLRNGIFYTRTRPLVTGEHYEHTD